MKLPKELERKCLDLADRVGSPAAARAVVTNSVLPEPKGEAQIVRVTLSLPPSTNNLYATVVRRGKAIRVKTKEYRAWLQEAAKELWPRAHVPSPAAVSITVFGHVNERRDLGNFEKATVDALVAAGVLTDDSMKHLCFLSLRRGDDGTTNPRLYVHVWNTLSGETP